MAREVCMLPPGRLKARSPEAPFVGLPHKQTFGGNKKQNWAQKCELPRGPNDQTNSISLEIFSLDRNF